jgi:hypothetical protein
VYGIQDVNEITPGVTIGATVTLGSPRIDGIYGNLDDQTWTTTTDTIGSYYFSTLSTADNRKPSSWTGVGNVLLQGYDYQIEVAVPNERFITIKDISSNSKDNIDNDAQFIAGKAIVNFKIKYKIIILILVF